MHGETQEELEREYSTLTLRLGLVGLAATIMLTVGTVFYHFVEDLKWLDAIYFCTITLATVGYGDIVPHTDPGKIFTIFYVIGGVGIIATLANLLIKQSALRILIHRNKKQQ